MTFDEACIRNVDDLTKAYLHLRHHIDKQTDALKDTLKPFKTQMEVIEAALQKKLIDAGANSIKTPHGTPYLSTKVSAKVENWETFYAFVQEVQDDELLEKRANKTKVEEYADQMGKPVPGITMTSVQTLNVRS